MSERSQRRASQDQVCVGKLGSATPHTSHGPRIVRAWPVRLKVPASFSVALTTQINTLHSTETWRDGLRHTWPPSHRYFTDGVLCWVGKNPSRPGGCLVRKGSPACQDPAAQESHTEEVGRQAARSGSQLATGLTHTSGAPGPPGCPGRASPPNTAVKWLPTGQSQPRSRERIL